MSFRLWYTVFIAPIPATLQLHSSSNVTARAQDLSIRAKAWLTVDREYVSVGIGNQMKYVLIFVFYADQTTSARYLLSFNLETVIP